MAKRFTDTEKWTRNKWFRELPPEYKLFWLYVLDNCDSIGLWEEDIELANILINSEIKKDKALELFGDRIKIIESGKKWFVVYFCLFQYGVLDEGNYKNKPMQFHIKCLKFNNLWQDYLRTIDRVSIEHGEGIDSAKVKETVKDKVKETVKAIEGAEKGSKRPIKPSIPEIRDYARSIGLELDAEHFYHHYEANGWRQSNGRPIMSWKSAVITWKKNQGRFSQAKSNKLMPGANKYSKFGKGE